jgi:hypothetical protein
MQLEKSPLNGSPQNGCKSESNFEFMICLFMCFTQDVLIVNMNICQLGQRFGIFARSFDIYPIIITQAQESS